MANRLTNKTVALPRFPELQVFLEFWQKSLEGVVHSVTVAHSYLIKPAEIKPVDGIFSCIDQRLASLGRLDRLFLPRGRRLT